MNNYFIILAAGKGKRFNSKIPKQHIMYKNKPLFMHSVNTTIKSKLFKKVILVLDNVKSFKKNKNIDVIKGGNERYLSSKKALEYIRNKKVLDFGCGIKNWNSDFIGKYPKLIHGLDRSMPSSEGKDNVVEIFRDLQDLPFNDYEIVLSMAVFEHIDRFLVVGAEFALQLFQAVVFDS